MISLYWLKTYAISIFSNSNDQSSSGVGRRNCLPAEPASHSGADVVSDNLLLSSISPIKSPPYSIAESDDNSSKGTGTF